MAVGRASSGGTVQSLSFGDRLVYLAGFTPLDSPTRLAMPLPMVLFAPPGGGGGGGGGGGDEGGDDDDDDDGFEGRDGGAGGGGGAPVALAAGRTSVDLEPVVEDEEGEPLDMPPVRYQLVRPGGMEMSAREARGWKRRGGGWEEEESEYEEEEEEGEEGGYDEDGEYDEEEDEDGEGSSYDEGEEGDSSE